MTKFPEDPTRTNDGGHISASKPTNVIPPHTVRGMDFDCKRPCDPASDPRFLARQAMDTKLRELDPESLPVPPFLPVPPDLWDEPLRGRQNPTAAYSRRFGSFG